MMKKIECYLHAAIAEGGCFLVSNRASLCLGAGDFACL